VEGGDAHRGQRGEVLDAQRLVIVTADPGNRPGQVREVVTGAVSASSAAIFSGRRLSTKASSGSAGLAWATCPMTGSSTGTMRNWPGP
jgi:hypothetical protein